MKYNIIRENDIRGQYPDEINEKSVQIIAKAYAYYLNEKGVDTCIIGHDNRLSSESINTVLIDTLLNSGLNIIDIGLVTTPMFNYASMYYEIPNGIMITASHNKASDNGLKIFGENYLHIKQDELKILGGYIKDKKEIKGKGTCEQKNVKNLYIKMMTKRFGHLNKKVVIDCGNGTSSIIAKDIFSKIFVNVTYLNSESDGSFPVHNPDPNVESNLELLKSIVKRKKADFGIALDGDCDRVGIVDEKGNTIFTDYLIAIFAKEIIPKSQNKTVVLDVKCSNAIPKEITKIGGIPLINKNGSAYLERIMFETSSLIGGEFSGHIFFRDDYFGYDDGIYAGLRFAVILCKKNIEASKLTKDMIKYENTPEIRIKVDDNKKNKLINYIKKYVKEKQYQVNYIDGVRVEYDDGFALIRSSNTGPYITLRFEASTKEILSQRQNEFINLVNDYLK